MPTWRRAEYLPKTLESIRRQNYPKLAEVVVVNSGYDGDTHRIADELGCRYSEIDRDPYPQFQNIAKHWNSCVARSIGEIVILQTAEVVHESENVIADLVSFVVSGPKRVGTGLLRNLDKNDQFVDWYNHPAEGSRPGWKSGAGPIAIKRGAYHTIGGFEETFYGYGHEDDFFYYCLNKNGFDVQYVPTAVCGHRDHPRMPFEVITCQANRCLLRTLWTEIEDGKRFPLANYEPPIVRPLPESPDIAAFCNKAISLGAGQTFAKWYQAERTSPQTPEDTFVVHREIANEKPGGTLNQMCEMLVESVWAAKMHNIAIAEAMSGVEPRWEQRCFTSAQRMASWSAVAYGKALDYALLLAGVR